VAQGVSIEALEKRSRVISHSCVARTRQPSRDLVAFAAACAIGVLAAPRSSADVTFGAAETRANSFTAGQQRMPAADSDGVGSFVVVWASAAQDGSGYGVFGQRYNGSAAPVGGEFHVNTSTGGDQKQPSVAVSKTDGSFLVVWQSAQDVLGQRYAPGGAPAGGEFRVNAVTGGYQGLPRAAAGGGVFVVVWQDATLDGSGYGIYAQRVSSSGGMLGAPFRANGYTTGNQILPAVAADASGNFVVVWQSYHQGGSGWSIHGQRFSSNGASLGGEFLVSATAQATSPSVAVGASKTLVLWETTSTGPNTISGAVFQNSNGAFVRTEFPITAPTTLKQTQPHAVGGPQSDNFVDLFVETDPASQFSIISAAQTDGTGATSAKTRVNSIQQPAGEPSGAPTSNGGVFAYWNMASDVYGRIGSPSGGSNPTPTPTRTPSANPTPTPTPTHTPTPTPTPTSSSCSCTVKGDVNKDCKADAADVFFLIDYLFAAGPRPACSGDMNNNHKVDIDDVFYLLNYLFAGGPAPL
jgi:hypothetical protein